MLGMDGFDVLLPASLDEAVAMAADDPPGVEGAGTAWLAGGTDLLPNLKHRLLRPRRLVALGDVLPSGWHREGDAWVIGAGTRLADLARMAALPELARAASLVAGPQVRAMGTLGGNVLLDTRCRFYNRTPEWRAALGGCLKAEGDWCHVTGGPRTCVATRSGDTVPVLLALGARARLLGPAGPRELPLADLYRFDGRRHLALEPGEVLSHLVVPAPPPDHVGSYDKLRLRRAIDFPLLGVAVALRREGRGEDARVVDLTVVVGAVNPRPAPVRGLEPFRGRRLDADLAAEVAEVVRRRTRPVAALAGDPAWRRRMAGVFVRRALLRLRDA